MYNTYVVIFYIYKFLSHSRALKGLVSRTFFAVTRTAQQHIVVPITIRHSYDRQYYLNGNDSINDGKLISADAT